MATISKFYLHAAATADTGTLPSATNDVGGNILTSTYSVVAAGAGTNRAMDGTIGISQASIALNTLASSSSQSCYFGRWFSPPLAAQVVAVSSLTWTHSFAASEANAASNFIPVGIVAQFRPSSGTFIASITSNPFSAAEPGTIETAESTTSTNGAFTLADGDVLVFEFTGSNTQSMSTAYANTYFFDGTTEASASTCASFISSTVAFTLFTPAALSPSPIIRPGEAVRRSYTWFTQAPWKKRSPGGVLIPDLVY